jgi:hypothetical protein
MSRDSGGILPRGVFAISNWHTKPPSSVMPRQNPSASSDRSASSARINAKRIVFAGNQCHSRTPIVVVVSFSTAFYRLIYPSAVTIWIAHRMISAFSVKLKCPE